MSCHHYLPKDLIIKILHRLPGKSLIRFKCVSKSWNSTISSFKFRPRTLLYSHTHCQLFLSSYDETVFQDVPRPWHMVQNYANISSIEIARNMLHDAANIVPQLSGLANGLLLITIDTCFFLWNPFTGYFNIVLNEWKFGNSPVGFCYEPSTNDYKLVTFTCSEFMVMSLRERYWKKAKRSYHDIEYADIGPFVEGHLHWIVAYKNNNLANGVDIISFDPKTDQFLELPILKRPKYDDGKDLVIEGLGELKGKLCVFWRCPDRIEVTVMNVHGVAESWTSLFTITIWDDDGFVPWSFTSREGELVMSEGNGKVGVYNPTSHSYRNIDLCTYPHLHGLIRMLPAYEPNLVSPFPMKQNCRKKRRNLNREEEENRKRLY